MKWRIIVNILLTEDKNSALRNEIHKLLGPCGMKPVAKNSRSWECTASPAEAVGQLKQVMDRLAEKQKCLDVLSIYIDQAKGD
jgi:hypothetical protein